MHPLLLPPNWITLARIVLIPIFIYVYVTPFANHILYAVLLFVVLALSDTLDGYLARRFSWVSSFGKLMDPIADKLLIISALALLTGNVPFWMILIIVIRELAVTIHRLFLVQTQVVEARFLGKIKTTAQLVAIITVMLSLAIGWWLMLLAVVLTVISGIDYFRSAMKKR